jgi:hypothetical protein
VRNRSGELINPADRLYEHAIEDASGPGAGKSVCTCEVTAIVATSFPIDEWENPHMGEWMKNAVVNTYSYKPCPKYCLLMHL